MLIHEMYKAIREAKDTMQAGDRIAADMLRLLVGRLKHCNAYTLAEIKKELRDFNIHTKEWKQK